MFHAILGIPHGWRTSSNIFERLYPDATEKSRCQQLLRLGNQQFHDPRGEIWTICLSVFFDNDFVNAVYMYIIVYICIWCVYICICTQNFNINLLYSIPIMFNVFFLCCEVSMHFQPIRSDEAMGVVARTSKAVEPRRAWCLGRTGTFDTGGWVGQ